MFSNIKVDLGPITLMLEMTKGQVRHRLRVRTTKKVSGSLLEGSVPLTKEV